MIVATVLACAVGAPAHISGMSHSAPYVLIWNSQENLEEYDAGEWPSPSQILRRARVADNDRQVVTLECKGRFVRVRSLAGRTRGVSGWVNADELEP